MEFFNVIKLLIDSGADISLKNKQEKSAWMYTIENNNFSLLTLFMDSKSYKDIEDKELFLHYAAKVNAFKVLRFFINKGWDVNYRAKDGTTAIQVATHEGHFESVKVLLSFGANPNNQDRSGSLSLSCAAYQGYTRLVKHLLENGADPHMKNESGITSLMKAARGGNMEVIELLLEKGVDVSHIDNEGYSALVDASETGQVQVVRRLLPFEHRVEVLERAMEVAMAEDEENSEQEVLVDAAIRTVDKAEENREQEVLVNAIVKGIQIFGLVHDRLSELGIPAYVEKGRRFALSTTAAYGLIEGGKIEEGTPLDESDCPFEIYSKIFGSLDRQSISQLRLASRGAYHLVRKVAELDLASFGSRFPEDPNFLPFPKEVKTPCDRVTFLKAYESMLEKQEENEGSYLLSRLPFGKVREIFKEKVEAMTREDQGSVH